MYKINEELNKQLKDVSLYTAQFGTEVGVLVKAAFDSKLNHLLSGPTLSLPEQIKENCQEESYDMVNKYNTQDNAACVQSPKLLSLITSLSALMLQVKRVADGER